MTCSRKDFLKDAAILTAGSFLMPGFLTSCSAKRDKKLFFDISLAEWSLNEDLFNGKLSHLQFPETAKKVYGINAVEYVNQFFMDKAKDREYLKELNQRCNDLSVDQLLIMIDAEGDLASTNQEERMQAVENHYKWVEAAQFLGCHSIRVNLFGEGTKEELKRTSVDSLGQLAEFAKNYDINILVENHGGYSSNGTWLANVMQQVDMENCGTLPDFGNFCIKRENGRWEGACTESYDRYKGVKQLMPYAKGVSAKSYDFNEEGFETTIDFDRMLNIVYESGFRGHIGVEFEGSNMSAKEGINATKNLLLTLGQKITKRHGTN